MKSLDEFIAEAGGASAGKIEIAKVSADLAYDYTKRLFAKHDMDLDKELPNFIENYKFAQRKASMGWTRRADMPVLSSNDLEAFETRLKDGTLDVVLNPKADSTDSKRPFPERLAGSDAKEFLSAGSRDGSPTDDKIRVMKRKVAAKDLNPIQKQIYFDKVIHNTVKYGVKEQKAFFSKATTVTSADNYIIDGHHRFLGSLLIDPDMKLTAISIDLPIKKLLPLSVAYSDAIGNQRNK